MITEYSLFVAWRKGGGGKSRPLSSPFPPENHVIPKNPPSPPPPPASLLGD